MNTLTKLIAAVASLLAPVILLAQRSPTPSTAKAARQAFRKMSKHIFANMYAFGADTQVTVGAPKETDIPGLLEIKIDVKVGDNLAVR